VKKAHASLLCVVLAGGTSAAGEFKPHCARYANAERLFQKTEFSAAAAAMEATAKKDAHAWELLGRARYMDGDFKRASEALEKAVAADPTSSAFQNWLGKAYGRRAEHASPFTAPGLAAKSRQAFEHAVRLDPSNKEAANDLFEYYLQAPGFLGGGLDKAGALGAKIAERDPVEGHWAKARLAERRKEFGTAEEHLRRALDLAPMQVGRVIDLAKFLAHRGRHEESDQLFLRAEAIAPASPKVLFERAETYLNASRNIEQARNWLKRYLSSELTPNDPPRADAEKLLRKANGM
jgi:tetratricopeptide (TPR) repeat protein